MRRLMVFVGLVLALVAAAQGAADRRTPHVGYLYPAGGQKGTVVEVTAGGQNLRGIKDVIISGEDITARVVEYEGQLKKLNQDQRKALGRQVRTLRQNKMATLYGWKRPARKPPAGDADEKPVELPDHPMLQNLDKLSIEGLDMVVEEFVRPSVLQINPQIAETAALEITIDPNALPGRREIRVLTNTGLSNPVVFEVGSLPEAREPAFRDPGKTVTTRVTPPVVVNGQILPGEVDRFRFSAKQGQRLVIETQARKLIPYLGDAVPGWFQATVTLLDDKGREAAFADDWRFDPDPVLCYEIPKAGDYMLEINDAIYRGRDDFVYRVSIAEKPFVTSVFPLGVKQGKTADASIRGWNLTEEKLALKGDLGIQRTALTQNGMASNAVAFAVDNWPERMEADKNNTLAEAEKIKLPRIVNGRIETPGDRDQFRFEGKAGQTVVAEVWARRLNSPLDSLLYLTDPNGSVLEWNDDHANVRMGLETHHADSRLTARLPEDGTYYVQLRDAQSHGGGEYGYRLHVGPPRPDYALYVTPSSLNFFAGQTESLCVHAVRTDGFDGEIEVTLKDAPNGFKLSGCRIPPGVSRIRMTLTAPRKALKEPVVLRLQGTAKINGKAATRPVTAAEDMMQAFIYRHLVPAGELMAHVRGGRQAIPFRQRAMAPLPLPIGGTARMQLPVPNRPQMKNLQFELSEPPAGIRLEKADLADGQLALTLAADANETPAVLADNLIVEIYAMVPQRDKQGNETKKINKVSLGVLPAIPFEIVNAQTKQ